MIVPQLAWGGWTPMPRIDSADSVKMLNATMSGKNTITLGATLGRISLRRMCKSEAPEAIAAWMNSRSFSEKTMPRIGRAT